MFMYNKNSEQFYKQRLRDLDPLESQLEVYSSFFFNNSYTSYCLNMSKPWRDQMGINWFDNMTKYVHLMVDVRNFLIDDLEDTSDETLANNKVLLIVYSTITFIMFIVCIVTYYLVYKVKKKVDQYSEEITRKTSKYCIVEFMLYSHRVNAFSKL